MANHCFCPSYGIDSFTVTVVLIGFFINIIGETGNNCDRLRSSFIYQYFRCP